ncbi:MAG: hypothetical protein ABI895_14955 [Deltaproteobacteria bacterium]
MSCVSTSDNLEALEDRAEDPILQVSNLFDRGRSRANLGQIELAQSDFRAASELATRAHCQYFLGRISNSAAWVHRELEDLEEARRRDEAALELGRQHRDAFSRLHALLNLAAAHARSGNQGGARAQVLLTDAEQLSETQEFGCNRHKLQLRVLIVKCEVLQCQTDLSAATAVALEALALATSKGARKYIALAHWQLGQIHAKRGALAESTASLRAALSALRERPCPLLAWRVYAALGELNLELAKESARSDFTRAREVIDAIASNLGAGELKDTFLGSARVERVHALTR